MDPIKAHTLTYSPTHTNTHTKTTANDCKIVERTKTIILIVLNVYINPNKLSKLSKTHLSKWSK